MSQRSIDVTPQQSGSSFGKKDADGRCSVIRRQLKSCGISESASEIITSSWKEGTRKQYSSAWDKWYFWCLRRHSNPFDTTQAVVISYLNFLRLEGKSYSVINTHKSMLLQTLQFFDNEWCSNACLISRFMKGLFHVIPLKPRYQFTWDVSKVLTFLSTLFPLDRLSMKMLTLKLTALIALLTAPRAQTLQWTWIIWTLWNLKLFSISKIY